MEKLTGKCIRKYFQFTTIFGDELTDIQRQQVFAKLAGVYLIDSKNTVSLYERCENKNIRHITTVQQCAQTKRLIQYFKENGLPIPLTGIEIEILEIKSNAIFDCINSEIITEAQIELHSQRCANLMTKSGQGNVIAMSFALFMLNENILTDGNKDKAKAILTKLGHWIDLDGYLFALYYDKENKDTYLKRMYTLIKNKYISDADLYAKIKSHYKGSADETDNTVKSILELEEKGLISCDIFSNELAQTLHNKLGFGG